MSEIKSEIKVTFQNGGVSLECKSVSNRHVLEAIMTLAHTASEHSVEIEDILTAAFMGADKKVFSEIAAHSKPIGDGVSISTDLEEILKGFKG